MLHLVDPYHRNLISFSEIVACFSQYMVPNVKVAGEGEMESVALLEKFANCCNIAILISE